MSNYVLTLIRPDYSSPEWEMTPQSVRNEVRALMDILENAPKSGIAKYLQQAAIRLDCEFPTLRTKYYRLIKHNGDWRCLVDKRKLSKISCLSCRTHKPVFIGELLRRVENYKRNNTAAFRELRRDWQDRRGLIPGYEDWPGWPTLPVGWSNRNLSLIVKQNTNLARQCAQRGGTSAKTNPHLPTVRTSRKELWQGAVIEIDDVWHDNLVTLGARRELVRVLELGALDRFSACRFHYGAKPRRSNETINGNDVSAFLAGMFHTYGYSPRGTSIMSEHATAKVSERIARILSDSTNGGIIVDYQPIEGKQAALTQFWSGTEGGNFRSKAALESLHNLMHNNLANLPMQIGSHSSGIQGPVVTQHIEKYWNRIVKECEKRFPEAVHKLRFNVPDFHMDFYPFMVNFHDLIMNGRTDHDLQDWEALGFVVTEYCLAPGMDQYISEQVLATLPPASQIIIAEAAKHDPKNWTRRRKLSPKEVWNKREKFIPLPPLVICEIMGQNLARDVTSRHGFLEFSDQELSNEPLIYSAQFISGPRRGLLIPPNEKVSMFVLPFAPDTALCQDAKGCFLGEVPLYKKVNPIEPTAFFSPAPFAERPEIRSQELINAAKQKHEQIAITLAPSRHLHQAEVLEAKEIRRHNRDVLAGAPVTPEEKKAAKASGTAADIIRRSRKTAECPF